MEREFYNPAMHRPKANILVGFSYEDFLFSAKAMVQAKVYMEKRLIGNDGLTDGDRIRLEKARKISNDWRYIVMLACECETELCKEALKKEIERAYSNTLRFKKMRYDD